MAMVLQQSRLRLTKAIYFGKPPGGGGGTVTAISAGEGITVTPGPIVNVGSVALGTLTQDHDFGAYDIQSRNSAQVFNVRAYLAVADAQVIANGAMGVGSTHLTSASNLFVLADVGKLVTVDGGALGGTTLVTTISAFNSAGDVTLAAPNASGGALAGKICFWGTDNTTAFDAATAAAAAQPSGGIVQVDSGRYMFSAGLTLDNKSVTMRGVAGDQSGGSIGSQLIFTQAAGTMISAQPITTNLHLERLNIRVENTAFAGAVIKVNASGLFFMDECIVDGGGSGSHAQPAAFTGVDLTTAIIGQYFIRRTNFCNGGGTSIDGGATANITVIKECQFVGQTVPPVKNLGQGSCIQNNNFEGIGLAASAKCGAITQTGSAGISIRDNWFGDNLDAATAGQVWITLNNVAGVEISGNMIGVTSLNYTLGGGNATAIKFTGVCLGVSIHGNDIGNGTTDAGTTGIDYGGLAHTTVNQTGNRYSCATPVTGTTLLSSNCYLDKWPTNAGSTLWSQSLNVIGPSALIKVDGQTTNNAGVMVLASTAANAPFGYFELKGVTATPYFEIQSGDSLAWRDTVINPSGGNLGVQALAPTRTLDVGGVQRLRGVAAPAVSEANSGTIYFDSATNKLKASLNGSAYVDVIGSGGVTGSGMAGQVAYWDGVTSLASPSGIFIDAINNFVGIATPLPAYSLDVGSDMNLGGGVYRYLGQVALAVDTFNSSAFVASGGGTVPAVGFGSTLVGFTAGVSATGAGLTAIGSQVLATSTGSQNTGVGSSSLFATTAGADNTAIGYVAGATNTTGSNNIFIGSGADATAGNLNHAAAIGTGATIAQDNCLNIGGGIQGTGIGTSTPKVTLHVGGSFAISQYEVTLVNGLNSDITPLVTTGSLRIVGPTGAFSIGGFDIPTGIPGITGPVGGQLLYVFNSVAFQMTIVNEDGPSTPAFRIKTLTGADVVLRAGTSAATFMYDDAVDRWVLMSSN